MLCRMIIIPKGETADKKCTTNLLLLFSKDSSGAEVACHILQCGRRGKLCKLLPEVSWLSSQERHDPRGLLIIQNNIYKSPL